MTNNSSMTNGPGTASDDISIRIKDLDVVMRLRDRDFQAIGDVSIDIRRHETLVLVGPSGCGKTTLLNVIGGFQAPTSGDALLDGSPIGKSGADRAVVFQADAVFPWLTVRQNLEYGPKIRGEFDAGAKERVEHFLSVLGLKNFQNEYPKVLSGGMRKRVDVARAYVSSPKVMLLDEPFGALDDMTKSFLQEELVRLSVSDPMTTVFVTHDIEEAIFIGDRIAVMTAGPGRIQEVIEVPYERPRPAEVRTSSTFQDIRRHIQTLLRESQPSRVGATS